MHPKENSTFLNRNRERERGVKKWYLRNFKF